MGWLMQPAVAAAVCVIVVAHVMAESAKASAAAAAAATGNSTWPSCNLFRGKWILDSSSDPLYNASACPFVEREFSCIKNGRPDRNYLNYRWQPLGCSVARFDGGKLLKRLRGKSIMFVGDSLSKNQFLSFICLLHSSLPTPKYTYSISVPQALTTFIFPDYGVKVMLNRNVFLVDVVREKIGRVLKLDSVEVSSKLWKGIDYFVFNTWHWWNRRGSGQPWDYVEVDKKIYKDINRMVAFDKALNTWGAWIDANIDPTKTRLFFQGISPSHYNGSEWGEPKAKTCAGQKQPLLGLTYPGGLPPAVSVLKSALSKINKPVVLLDVTNLSLLRKDGHPSRYGLGGPIGMDCSHWCLAGVPDTWNTLLYNLLIS